jgi:hypothetical protein
VEITHGEAEAERRPIVIVHNYVLAENAENAENAKAAEERWPT